MPVRLPEAARVIPLGVPLSVQTESGYFNSVALAQDGSELFFLLVSHNSAPTWIAENEILGASVKA